jgi:hypothetical protein
MFRRAILNAKVCSGNGPRRRPENSLQSKLEYSTVCRLVCRQRCNARRILRSEIRDRQSQGQSRSYKRFIQHKLVPAHITFGQALLSLACFWQRGKANGRTEAAATSDGNADQEPGAEARSTRGRKRAGTSCLHSTSKCSIYIS